MRITEADYEYLLHTLSEARSRATEIAASISARLGREHPLAQLANDAALKVERVLRDVQKNAAEPADLSPKVFEISSGAPAVPASSLAEPTTLEALPWASFSRESGLGPEHWVSQFVEDLMREVHSTGAITFDTAGRLLEQHQQNFEKELAIARRMLRTYPHLFHEELEGARAYSRRRTFIAQA